MEIERDSNYHVILRQGDATDRSQGFWMIDSIGSPELLDTCIHEPVSVVRYYMRCPHCERMMGVKVTVFLEGNPLLYPSESDCVVCPVGHHPFIWLSRMRAVVLEELRKRGEWPLKRRPPVMSYI